MSQPSHRAIGLPLQLLIGALTALAVYIGFMPDALATLTYQQGTGFAGGGGLNVQVFYCTANGKAVGNLFGIFNYCPTTVSTDNIFSFLTCNIERLSTELFGGLYCGIIRELEPAIQAVLTLAVVVFGVGFTIGLIPFTGRDMLAFLLKIVLVYVFATQADYMIGIAYRFFVTSSQEGISIVVSSLFVEQHGPQAGSHINGGNIFSYIDATLNSIITLPSESEGANIHLGQNPCQNAVFAALGILLIAFPPFFFMALLMAAKIAMVFLRGIFGYLFSLIGLAFLMLLSPIFLSFSLWQQTRSFFDKWLGYLVSFSLQIVIVFAFMAFIFSIPVGNISGSFFDIIMYNKSTVETATMRMPWQYCTICDFQIVKIDPDSGEVLRGNNVPDQPDILDPKTNMLVSDYFSYGEGESVNPAKSRLICKQPLCPLQPASFITPENYGDPGTSCRQRLEEQAAASGTASGTGGVLATQDLQNQILTFMMSGLLSLLVLAYVVDQLLTYTPLIAQILANGLSANYAPQLGGGHSLAGRTVVAMPFEDNINATANAFQEGYTYDHDEQGRRKPGLGEGTTIERTAIATQRAAKALLYKGEIDPSTNQRDPGLVGSMFSWFVNPTKGAEGEGN
jgi:hypothetical protein